MADKMEIDTTDVEKDEKTVATQPDLPPEKGMYDLDGLSGFSQLICDASDHQQL